MRYQGKWSLKAMISMITKYLLSKKATNILKKCVIFYLTWTERQKINCKELQMSPDKTQWNFH